MSVGNWFGALKMDVRWLKTGVRIDKCTYSTYI